MHNSAARLRSGRQRSNPRRPAQRLASPAGTLVGDFHSSKVGVGRVPRKVHTHTWKNGYRCRMLQTASEKILQICSDKNSTQNPLLLIHMYVWYALMSRLNHIFAAVINVYILLCRSAWKDVRNTITRTNKKFRTNQIFAIPEHFE